MEKFKNFFPALFFLGFLEFGVAAFIILRIEPDPKNALLFGYSLQRIALFVLTIFPGLVLLALSGLAWRGKITEHLECFIQKRISLLGLGTLCMVLISLLILVTPPAWLGGFSGYYRRLQPLLFVVCSYPIQVLFPWLIRKGRRPNKLLVYMAFIFSAAITVFWAIVLLTGLGITPEKEFATNIVWNNIAGTPFTMFQWLFSLLITLAGAVCIFLVLKVNSNRAKWMDIGIAIGLYFLTVLLWAQTPFKESSFASKLIGPYYQPFPLSDAAVHDLGALSILQGQGINFGAYTDKPIYMSFLAILHLFAGYNYALLVFLQICFLAFMTPALYYLGKSFHSRALGILMALVILTQQRNAILLTNVLYYNAAPNLLMTEVPTLLGLILFTGCWFIWMKRPQAWVALSAGGILGTISLIRLNPVLFLPVIPVFALLVMWRDKKRWLFQSIAYLIGFALLITPWLFTGTNPGGRPYFLIKFYDVINVRYGGSASLPVSPTHQPVVESDNPQQPFQMAASIDVNRFPGFVTNNFMHNIVESFLVLPDSFSPQRQNLSDLDQRFYWTPEKFDRSRIPYLILNCFLVAIGLAWSWRRWKWSGMVPLLAFLFYSLSLALGRTSGSRYLVPIDWIFFIYYSVGVLTLFGAFLPISWLSIFQADVEAFTEPPALQRSKSTAFWVTLIALSALAMVVPVADILIRQNASLCRADDLPAIAARHLGSESVRGMDFRKGIVLYPRVEKKILTFDLLSCSQSTYMKMAMPFELVNSGDMVIVGWPAEEPPPDLLMISLIIPAE